MRDVMTAILLFNGRINVPISYKEKFVEYDTLSVYSNYADEDGFVLDIFLTSHDSSGLEFVKMLHTAYYDHTEKLWNEKPLSVIDWAFDYYTEM